MKLVHRRATAADWAFMLRLRNDADTVAQSFVQERVPEEAHRRWLAAKMADSGSRLLIYEDAGVPIGVGRADRLPHGIEVGITVAPECRGKGYAGPILSMLKEYIQSEFPGETLFAHIKEGNDRSVGAFIKAGFRPAGKVIYMEKYSCLEYVAAPR